jgi:hypothetical protein
MKRFVWLFVALSPCFLGCNQGSPNSPPAASDRSSQTVDRGQRVGEQLQRDVEKDLDDLANDVHDAIGGVRKRFRTEAEKKADELSEFAARMAEDAKDRAIDVPEMVDMMFEPRHRHDTYRPRARGTADSPSTGSRTRDTRR